MDNTKEYILCSAIKRKYPKLTTLNSPYWDGTNDIVNIEIGYRHHDIFQRFKDEVSKNPYHQGFYTSKGRFVGRYEAMKIAFESDQLINKINVFSNLTKVSKSNDIDPEFQKLYYPLYSEDLY